MAFRSYSDAYVFDDDEITISAPAGLSAGDTVWLFLWVTPNETFANWTATGWTNKGSTNNAKMMLSRQYAAGSSPPASWTIDTGAVKDFIYARALAYTSWDGWNNASSAYANFDNGLIIGSSFGNYKITGEGGWWTSGQQGIAPAGREFRVPWIRSVVVYQSSAGGAPAMPVFSSNTPLWTVRATVQLQLNNTSETFVPGEYVAFTMVTLDDLNWDLEATQLWIDYASLPTTVNESINLGNWGTSPANSMSKIRADDHWGWTDSDKDGWA